MHASVCLQLCYLLIPNDRVGCVKCGPGDGIQFQRSHNHILHDARVTADAEVSSASRSWRLKPRPRQSLSPATLKRADRPGHSPMPHLATYPWSQGGEPRNPASSLPAHDVNRMTISCAQRRNTHQERSPSFRRPNQRTQSGRLLPWAFAIAPSLMPTRLLVTSACPIEITLNGNPIARLQTRAWGHCHVD